MFKYHRYKEVRALFVGKAAQLFEIIYQTAQVGRIPYVLCESLEVDFARKTVEKLVRDYGVDIHKEININRVQGNNEQYVWDLAYMSKITGDSKETGGVRKKKEFDADKSADDKCSKNKERGYHKPGLRVAPCFLLPLAWSTDYR